MKQSMNNQEQNLEPLKYQMKSEGENMQHMGIVNTVVKSVHLTDFIGGFLT